MLFGVRTEEDLFWIDRLDVLATLSPFFSYYLTLSQPYSKKWDGLHGRVTKHLLQQLSNHAVYICGNPNMIKDVYLLLIKQGIEAKNIHFEII